jgi:protein-disulfide isomerase
MRKSITIAIVAFVAGAASTWTLSNTDASARNKMPSVAQTIDTLELTMKAGGMPSQQFDAH